MSSTKSRIVSNYIVSAWSEQEFSIQSLSHPAEGENLWAESQGCWTCTAAWSKKWSPCQNTCCVSHPDPSFPNRSVHLQPGQPLHYCVAGESGARRGQRWSSDKAWSGSKLSTKWKDTFTERSIWNMIYYEQSYRGIEWTLITVYIHVCHRC